MVNFQPYYVGIDSEKRHRDGGICHPCLVWFGLGSSWASGLLVESRGSGDLLSNYNLTRSVRICTYIVLRDMTKGSS